MKVKLNKEQPEGVSVLTPTPNEIKTILINFEQATTRDEIRACLTYNSPLPFEFTVSASIIIIHHATAFELHTEI